MKPVTKNSFGAIFIITMEPRMTTVATADGELITEGEPPDGELVEGVPVLLGEVLGADVMQTASSYPPVHPDM